MTDTSANMRNSNGEWRPAEPIALAPINSWPPRPGATFKWLVGFPGYLWPQNTFWLGFTLLTWFFLTPDLNAMKSFEIWWIAALMARNMALIVCLFGGLHLYFYTFKGQDDYLKFTTKPLAKNNRRFLFKDQVKDNIFYTLVFGVAIITGYEAITYWAFVNGYLGIFVVDSSPLLFFGWLIFLLIMAPAIYAIHLYFAHCLLHTKLLYKPFHALHHNNVEINPWPGLAMHPVEHILYFSTVAVQWLIALHPLNALYQIHLAAFYPALGHSGFEKLMIESKLGLDGGNYFHYLHHKYFECNYGGSLALFDKLFGTFHNGTEAASAAMRERIRAQREVIS